MSDPSIHASVQVGPDTYSGDLLLEGDPPPPVNLPPSAVFDLVSGSTFKVGGSAAWTAARSSDPEGDTLTYLFQTQAPDGTVTDRPSDGSFAFTWPSSGRWVIRCLVSDPTHAAVSSAAVYDVSPADPPPPQPTPVPTVGADGRLRTKYGDVIVPVGFECYGGNDSFPGPLSGTDGIVGEINRTKASAIRLIFTVAEQKANGGDSRFNGMSPAKMSAALAAAKAAGMLADVALAGGNPGTVGLNPPNGASPMPNGWTGADALNAPAYRDAIRPYEDGIVLHKGESYAPSVAAFVQETNTWISKVRSGGWRAPIMVWAPGGGRWWSALRDAMPQIVDPAGNVGFGWQTYWTGASYTDLDNTTDYWQKLSGGISLRTAIQQSNSLRASGRYVQLGLCTNQGDQAPKVTPWRGLIDYVTTQFPDLPWMWWDWTGGGLGDAVMQWTWAGPLSTDPVPPGRQVGVWHLDGSGAIDARYIAEKVVATARRPRVW